jgi:hypothetical protein
VIDTNPLFIDYLKHEIRDSRFHPVLGSAEDVEEIVGTLGHAHADYVLSGPAVLDPARRRRPGHRRRNLSRGAAGWRVPDYQFSTVARDLTARNFERVDTGITWLNIPPCLLAWGWKAQPATP